MFLVVFALSVAEGWAFEVALELGLGVGVEGFELFDGFKNLRYVNLVQQLPH